MESCTALLGMLAGFAIDSGALAEVLEALDRKTGGPAAAVHAAAGAADTLDN